ncbi:Hypothetical Protein RradSPS_2611 [Rubrobacter radiotolerans]|uniref:Uncharacterized protein n=1 Tax=Rubrobacter radiotolerans TaxID=42256 RepID=A0A023X752_RUBRA|nr:Hypothetical Protein RradSPS_2611 [Rubrobacter radiotolerans]
MPHSRQRRAARGSCPARQGHRVLLASRGPGLIHHQRMPRDLDVHLPRSRLRCTVSSPLSSYCRRDPSVPLAHLVPGQTPLALSPSQAL